jgi:hypothetical protein
MMPNGIMGLEGVNKKRALFTSKIEENGKVLRFGLYRYMVLKLGRFGK